MTRPAAPPADLPLLEQRVPLCPELRLELLAPEYDLDAPAARDLLSSPPYWAFAWAGGQALARFVLDRPALVAGDTVVDFGAGSGLVALAAARAGAARVIACDLDPRARAAIRRNARRNGLQIEIYAELSRIEGLLLAADVCYEPANVGWLRGVAAAGVSVLVSDPERRGAPMRGLEPLARYRVTTCPDLGEPTTGACVYRVR